MILTVATLSGGKDGTVPSCQLFYYGFLTEKQMVNDSAMCMNDYIIQHRSKTDYRFYVYIHRRETNNSVFYVGKGTGSRAWHTHDRNLYWKNTKNKHGSIVEIVYDNLSEKAALELEKDLIAGLLEIGATLCNLTSGGEQTIVSAESRKRMSLIRKGRPLSELHKKALSASRAGKVRQDLEGSNNHHADETIYVFSKVDDSLIFIGTRLQLCKTFNLNHYSLRGLFLKGRIRKSSQGWKLLKEKDGTNKTES